MFCDELPGNDCATIEVSDEYFQAWLASYCEENNLKYQDRTLQSKELPSARKLENMMLSETLFLGYAPDLSDSSVLTLKNGNVLSNRMVCDPMLRFSTSKTQDGVRVQFQQLSSDG